jgi:hypothetical protein
MLICACICHTTCLQTGNLNAALYETMVLVTAGAPSTEPLIGNSSIVAINDCRCVTVLRYCCLCDATAATATAAATAAAATTAAILLLLF